MAGYSGTPLANKLGIKPGCKVAVLGGPRDFRATLGQVLEGVEFRSGLRGAKPCDVIVFFVDRKQALEQRFAEAAERLTPAGGLWIAWPKKASGVATDLNENLIRDIGLTAGLVDNKVCAIDETWSGLRFVRRLKDRPNK